MILIKNQWISMRINEYQWVSFKVKNLWILICSQNSFDGHFAADFFFLISVNEYHWISMNITKYQWISIEYQWVLIEYQWISLKESGESNCNWKIFAEDKSLNFFFLISINDNQWISMNINESQWISMNINEYQWISMRIKEIRRV